MSDEKSVSPAEGEKESAFSDIEVDDGEDALLSFLKGVKVPSAKAKRREDSLQDKSAAWMQMYNKKLRELKAKYSKKKATKSMRQAAKDYVEYLEKAVGCKITYVSVGAGRDEYVKKN